MSRTFTTRPLRGRKESWKPYHNHSRGDCDLVSLEEYLNLPHRVAWRRHCHWSYDWRTARDTRHSCEYERTEQRLRNKRQRQAKQHLREEQF